MPSVAPARLPLVQALRAVAALAVVLSHVLHEALSIAPHNQPLRSLDRFMPWNSGVDIFFVISGFVIVHASRREFGQPGAPRRFIRRRLARIVPLYWLLTSLFLVEAMMPGAVNGVIGGPIYIIKSYLFIPALRPDGVNQPALGLGWTLNYEMFFYLIFALFLRFRAAVALGGISLVLIALVAARQAGLVTGDILQTWGNPITLEFGGGMLLAVRAENLRLGRWTRLALVAGALAALHLQPQLHRAIAWGIPASALMLAAITGKAGSPLRKPELWLARLGDSSYALYLVHPFIMRAASRLWHPHSSAEIYAYVVVVLVLAQFAALGLHRYVEKPVFGWLRARLDDPRERLAPVRL